MPFAWTIVALVVVLAVAWRFLGSYMVAVYEGRTRWLSFVERPAYRVMGVDPANEQSWQRYGGSAVALSAPALLLSCRIFPVEGSLPFKPHHLPGGGPAPPRQTAVAVLAQNTHRRA